MAKTEGKIDREAGAAPSQKKMNRMTGNKEKAVQKYITVLVIPGAKGKRRWEKRPNPAYRGESDA